jgi:alkaline phosphatase isozyme conversion protein
MKHVTTAFALIAIAAVNSACTDSGQGGGSIDSGAAGASGTYADSGGKGGSIAGSNANSGIAGTSSAADSAGKGGSIAGSNANSGIAGNGSAADSAGKGGSAAGSNANSGIAGNGSAGDARAWGSIARAGVEALSNRIGARIAGTSAETQAVNYIFDEFTRLGYEPEMDEFAASSKGIGVQKTVDSANVIAEKRGRSDLVIIVGAHYDSADVGQGADDNASGVGIMLEGAERLARVETPYTIRFVAFGAEEPGQLGSYHYVEQMSAAEIQKTVAFINMDSLLAGDITYIYGNAGANGRVRDWALDWADAHDYDLQTQTGLNPDYPAGTTGPFSDQVAFEEAGIQYAYFEATNWTTR